MTRHNMLIAILAFAALAGCSGLEMLDGGARRTLFITAPPSPQKLINHPDASHVGTEPLWIGSWNVHQLGPSRVTPQERRSPAEFARYLIESGVSIVALQEIGQSPGLPEGSNAFLDELVDELNDGTEGDWVYSLSSPRYNDIEMCGVLWDRTVVTAHESVFGLDVGAGQLSLFGMVTWDIIPQAIRFSTGGGLTDFILIVVHLQSDLGGFLAGPQRVHETDALLSEIERLRRAFNDDDIIILGDFNAPNSTAKCIEMFRDAGFVDLNQMDVGTFVFGPPFDRILVPQDQPEFSRGFFVAVMNGYAPEEFQRRLSDHYLVISPIYPGPDDD